MTTRHEPPFMTLGIRDPDTSVRPVRDGASFQLEAGGKGVSVVIELAPAALQTLALECMHAGALLNGSVPLKDIEDAFKRPALALKAYGPAVIAEVTARLGIADLAAFLWYMQDRQLIEWFLHEMATSEAARLMSELDFYTLFDRSHEDTVKIGRRAVLQVMQTLQVLTDDESSIQEAAQEPSA
jgi:hypothetical protein